MKMNQPASSRAATPDSRTPLKRNGSALFFVADPSHFLAAELRPSAAATRRQEILACAIFGTGALGAIPALRPLLGLTALALAVSALYVVVIVRLGARATERTVKLRYLPEPVVDEPTIVIRRAAR